MNGRMGMGAGMGMGGGGGQGVPGNVYEMLLPLLIQAAQAQAAPMPQPQQAPQMPQADALLQMLGGGMAPQGEDYGKALLEQLLMGLYEKYTRPVQPM